MLPPASRREGSASEVSSATPRKRRAKQAPERFRNSSLFTISTVFSFSEL